jgi:hypothetical protein
MVAATTETAVGSGARSAARDCHPKYAAAACQDRGECHRADDDISSHDPVPRDARPQGPGFGNVRPAVWQHDHSVPLRSQDGSHKSKRVLANGDVACAVGSARLVE